jgi:hypothetical protein
VYRRYNLGNHASGSSHTLEEVACTVVHPPTQAADRSCVTESWARSCAKRTGEEYPRRRRRPFVITGADRLPVARRIAERRKVADLRMGYVRKAGKRWVLQFHHPSGVNARGTNVSSKHVFRNDVYRDRSTGERRRSGTRMRIRSISYRRSNVM